MKFTCLSEGKGFHFPPCSILQVQGFQILFDCPLDLSALLAFSPLTVNLYSQREECCHACPCDASSCSDCGSTQKKRKIEDELDVGSLIRAEPWYKTVKSLKLWDVSSIDAVLICGPMGMLGLPFLTRDKDFSATVYATEATARIARLMMEDLVTMHKETRLFYGPEGPSPEWLKWDEIELLPSALKEILIGRYGGDLGGWMPLYSAADVSNCMQRVQPLKFAEEACYNGILRLKAFSSGLDFGTCNWSITSPKQNIAYISGSIFASEIATKFDYHALRGSDVILFSDCTAADLSHKDEVDFTSPGAADELPPNLSEEPDAGERISEFLLNHGDFADESKKLNFLCSWALKSINAGGSVLITISRLGLVLKLLEHIAFSLQSQDLKVPIYIISSVAEELLAFLKVMPEWLCKQRQEKFHSDQSYFSFVDLIEQRRILLFSAIYASELLAIWEEPCIVFCPHLSLRIGPSVHLLQRWCGETDSLLIIEEGVDANLACLPYQPMAMKVLHCSFPSGMKLREAEYLLQFLNPKYVLMPEKLKQDIRRKHSYPFIYYHENETLHIPRVKNSTDVDSKIDLDCQLCSTKMEQEETEISTAKGEFSAVQGKIHLGIGHEQILRSQTRPLICMGSVDLQSLLTSLKKLGMNARVEEVISPHCSENTYLLHVVEPKKALLQLTSAHTIIIASDESLASVLTEAVHSILDCI